MNENSLLMRALISLCGILLISLTLVAQQPPPQTTSAPPAHHVNTPSPATYDELKQLLKNRHDGKIVMAAVEGLYAGEQRKGDFGVGPGENGIYWSHFAANMQVPDRIGSAFFGGKKTSDLSQLDKHTFGDLKRGLNLSPIQKGEPLTAEESPLV